MNEHLVLTVADLTLTKSGEGVRLSAYPDPGTGASPWTIGYGHTGPEVHAGLVWTQAQADAALLADMAKAEAAVRAMVLIPLTQEEFIALCDFVFNVGSGHFATSTLRAKLNAGDLDGAIAEFGKWNMAGGHVMAGLTKRRDAEIAEFLLGINYTTAVPSV
jgi:lysozyme